MELPEQSNLFIPADFPVANSIYNWWGTVGVSPGVQDQLHFEQFGQPDPATTRRNLVPIDLRLVMAGEIDATEEVPLGQTLVIYHGRNPLQVGVVLNPNVEVMVDGLEESWRDNDGKVPGVFENPIDHSRLPAEGVREVMLLGVCQALAVGLSLKLAEALKNKHYEIGRRHLTRLAMVPAIGGVASAVASNFEGAAASILPAAVPLTAFGAFILVREIGRYFNSLPENEARVAIAGLGISRSVANSLYRLFSSEHAGRQLDRMYDMPDSPGDPDQ